MDIAESRRSRAQRFEFALPAKLCSKADAEWRPVQAKNISSSGALLIESREETVGSELDVWLLMRDLRPAAVDILCPSVVVRCGQGKQKGLFDIGVKFKDYQFRRAER